MYTRISLIFYMIFFIPSLLHAKKTTIMLDWFVNPDHGNIIIAKQKGYFKEQGLEVKILEPATPVDPPKFSALKKVDYALNYQNTLQIQASKGWKNTRIATLISSPLASLIVLKSSGINSIKDLKGKKIGYSISGFEDVILKTMLKHNGVDIKDVKLVNVNWGLTSSLVTKNVDAVIGAYRNFELTELELLGYKGKAFFPEDNGVPMYDEITLITHTDNAYSEQSKKLVRALEKAVRYMKNYPLESWNVFKSYKPDLLDNKLNKRAWFDTLRRFSSTPSALPYDRYIRFAKFLKKQGLITGKIPPLSSYAVDIFRK